MARNVLFQVIRGITANMPPLGDGEFYFSTDEFQLYVGLGGDILPVGGTMAIQLADATNPAQKAAVDATGDLQVDVNNFPTQPTVGTDGSITVNVAGAALKSPVLKTGQLVSTATTANQKILTTYTVTAGKNLFLLYIDIQGRLTAPSATASILGTVIVQIGGVTVYTGTIVNPTTSDAGSQSIRLIFGEPLPLAAGTTIDIMVTPAAVTSMTWTANHGGYEK